MTRKYEEGFRRLSKLLNSLMSRADAGPFLEPVDWRGLELFDYPKIITKMVDLGSIKRKLERKQTYKTPHEAVQDIRLVWKNCWTYNMEGSDFYVLAKAFSKRFEDRYKKIKAECDMGEDEAEEEPNDSTGNSSGKKSPASRTATPTPSVDVKVRLASNLFLLNGKELGYVMQQIELRCPEALEQTAQDVEIGDTSSLEIKIDKLDSKTVSELDRHVMDKVGSHHASAASGKTEHSRPNKKRKK